MAKRESAKKWMPGKPMSDRIAEAFRAGTPIDRAFAKAVREAVRTSASRRKKATRRAA